jgi:hypothetical protein
MAIVNDTYSVSIPVGSFLGDVRAQPQVFPNAQSHFSALIEKPIRDQKDPRLLAHAPDHYRFLPPSQFSTHLV